MQRRLQRYVSCTPTSIGTGVAQAGSASIRRFVSARTWSLCISVDRLCWSNWTEVPGRVGFIGSGPGRVRPGVVEAARRADRHQAPLEEGAGLVEPLRAPDVEQRLLVHVAEGEVVERVAGGHLAR